ncbi:MAG: amylo-alpha-1,6-glucosidase [Armatimonadota bacterium]
MNFDLSHVPFSRRGSRYSIRHLPEEGGIPAGLFLCYVPRGRVFFLEVLKDGQPVEYTVEATPQALTIRGAGGVIDLVFETDERLRVRAEGLTLKLGSGGGIFNYALSRGEGLWQLNMFNANASFLLTRLRGEITIDAPWQITRAEYLDARIDGEAALEYFTTTLPRAEIAGAFDDILARAPQGFAAFLTGLPRAPEEFEAARELAGYVLWSATVKAQGNLERETVLMSKNHMTQVWSWDHCFNAMALAAGHQRLAWDQLMVTFDKQDAHGCLPDSMSQDGIVWNFVKPPVHGWALAKMLEANPKLADRLDDIYHRLSRWTDWWLAERDDDGDGLPQYNHGNDSGWDNATCFDVPPPVEGPDLAAFLITQMEALAAAAEILGHREQVGVWTERADRLFDALLQHSWDGTAFRARQSGTHATAPAGDSLIPFMPLLLGERLPAVIRQKLIAGVAEPGRFITEWGPATESPRSPLYQPDGYWRGPIWAPSTHLLYDGLLRCGQEELALDIARRFCRLCAKSGMAENFDALTGAPLRDKAYTWTASVFLLLAHELYEAS